MTSNNQQGKEPGKDKLLTAVFIGIGLVSFSYVAYNASHHDTSGTGNGEIVTPPPKPPEPPPGPLVTSSPPDIVRAHVDDLATRRASNWTDKDFGTAHQVIGADTSGRTIVDLGYSQSGYLGHYVFQYYENQTEPGVATVQIQKFEPTGPQSPGIFQNRCVGSTTYKLDSGGRLTSVELIGYGNQLEGAAYFDYDKWNGYLWCIRKIDSNGQQTSTVYSVGQQELNDALSPYYYSAQFSQKVPLRNH